MPVVINELHVRVNVEEDMAASEAHEAPNNAEDKDALVNACVEKVLDVLEQKKRR